MIRPCVSRVQLSGVKSGSGSSKGVEVEIVPGGLIMPAEGKIEEIRVGLSIGVFVREKSLELLIRNASISVCSFL